MKNVGYIYKITNKINGKSYIGQTIQTIEKRWKQHLRNKSHCHALRSALEKYGSNMFEITILVKCSSIQEMNHRERYCISVFNTLTPNGYNLTNGGIRPLFSSESKLKMAKKKEKHPLWGKKHSEESKELMSLAKIGKKKTLNSIEKQKKTVELNGHWNLGNKYTTKKKEEMSKITKRAFNQGKLAHLAENSRKQRIPIIRNDGARYESIASAAKDIQTSPSNILQHLKGKFKQIKGFTFSYGNLQ